MLERHILIFSDEAAHVRVEAEARLSSSEARLAAHHVRIIQQEFTYDQLSDTGTFTSLCRGVTRLNTIAVVVDLPRGPTEKKLAVARAVHIFALACALNSRTHIGLNPNPSPTTGPAPDGVGGEGVIIWGTAPDAADDLRPKPLDALVGSLVMHDTKAGTYLFTAPRCACA